MTNHLDTREYLHYFNIQADNLLTTPLLQSDASQLKFTYCAMGALAPGS